MYDLIIIGGSAAGITAGIYAARRGLKFLIIAKDFGGEVTTSGDIENWPGIIHTDGFTLAKQFKEHLDSYKPEVAEGALVSSTERKADGTYVVHMDNGTDHEAKTIIIATGVRPRMLGVPGEEQYRLKGVSYCTVCDGPIFKGKRTITIGGGNSALESALMLSDIAAHVTVINKNAQFKGEQVLIDKLKQKKNVDIVYEAMTTEVLGNGQFATGVKYKDKAGAEHTVEAEGTFVHIGQTPNSQMVPPECEKDPYGYITIGLDSMTNLPGLYAAGDVTHTAHKQIVIAAGQGASAALSAVQYLNRMQ